MRQKMIIFRYQLLHIGTGKRQITATLYAVQPGIKRYEDIGKQLKTKIMERRGLLAEKKTAPVLQVFRHRELAQKIAGLTEDIEELKSEKALLLNQLDCAGDYGVGEMKQHIASMESSLKTLNQQEKKYTAELATALAQYTALQQQAADMNTGELDAARQAIRPSKEYEVIQRLQAAYQKKFDSSLLTQSRKDIAALSGEAVEPISICQQLYRISQHQDKWHNTKQQEKER